MKQRNSRVSTKRNQNFHVEIVKEVETLSDYGANSIFLSFALEESDSVYFHLRSFFLFESAPYCLLLKI